MEVISTYFDKDWSLSRIREYEIWLYNRSKFARWVKHKHSTEQGIDLWDKFILSSMLPGKTVVYDSAAVYWKRIHTDVRIVENHVPAVVLPHVEILNENIDRELKGQVSNLLLFRPLSCKLTESLADYLTIPIDSRSGKTPKLVDWLAKDAKIYLSIGQEFFSFNRFQLTLMDFIQQEAKRLEQEQGLKLVLLKNSKTDLVNGNIKLIFERHNHGN